MRTGIAAVMETTRQLAAACDAQLERALARREQAVRAMGPIQPQDAADVQAALTLGDEARARLLRSILESRAALDRLRAIAPARHAPSSVACTG